MPDAVSTAGPEVLAANATSVMLRGLLYSDATDEMIDCVLYVPRALYLSSVSAWLDEKADYYTHSRVVGPGTIKWSGLTSRPERVWLVTANGPDNVPAYDAASFVIDGTRLMPDGGSSRPMPRRRRGEDRDLVILLSLEFPLAAVGDHRCGASRAALHWGGPLKITLAMIEAARGADPALAELPDATNPGGFGRCAECGARRQAIAGYHRADRPGAPDKAEGRHSGNNRPYATETAQMSDAFPARRQRTPRWQHCDRGQARTQPGGRARALERPWPGLRQR
jgi:hypothetical protein